MDRVQAYGAGSNRTLGDVSGNVSGVTAVTNPQSIFYPSSSSPAINSDASEKGAEDMTAKQIYAGR